jgi:hypothetical protein
MKCQGCQHRRLEILNIFTLLGFTALRVSLASSIDHVTARDFPETGEALSAIARETGIGQEPHELFRDATGFRRLMA